MCLILHSIVLSCQCQCGSLNVPAFPPPPPHYNERQVSIMCASRAHLKIPRTLQASNNDWVCAVKFVFWKTLFYVKNMNLPTKGLKDIVQKSNFIIKKHYSHAKYNLHNYYIFRPANRPQYMAFYRQLTVVSTMRMRVRIKAIKKKGLRVYSNTNYKNI